jgi:hypothetical protein
MNDFLGSLFSPAVTSVKETSALLRLWQNSTLTCMAGDLHHGIRLFNDAKFFDAHEVLEDVWRESPHAEKKFFQGLVQVAVAFHHHSTGNLVGMRSVLNRAMGNLEKCPPNFHEVDIGQLLVALAQWRDALDDNRPAPDLPRMETSGFGLDKNPRALNRKDC